MNIKPFLLWLPMIVLAFANAMLRELVIKKHYREFRAHQLSTLSLSILCCVYVWIVYPMLYIHNPRQTLLIGLVWIGLTMMFEFTLGSELFCLQHLDLFYKPEIIRCF
jgi:hypothetical protein